MSVFTRWRFLICWSVVLSVPAVAVACLWDIDTVRMERSRFPTVLELITGKFLRHSPEFYQWRIGNRLQRLQTEPENVALWDDLAVAYDKTGQHQKAIETGWQAERLQPGRYESAANLGTFYIHAGQLEEGLKYIDQALTINPNAHFGRERYQRWLVEYVLQRKQDGELSLPLRNVSVPDEDYPTKERAYIPTTKETFASFVHRRLAATPHVDSTPEAIKGVLGMMRFGQHDSPILLEALATLLEDGPLAENAKLMAARAYLRAAAVAPNPEAALAYRTLAAEALIHQVVNGRDYTTISLQEVETSLAKEMAEAESWYAELRQRELTWIAGGMDPEAWFARLYDEDPLVSDFEPAEPAEPWEWDFTWLLQDSIGRRVVLAVGMVAAAVAFRRRWGRIQIRRSESQRVDKHQE